MILELALSMAVMSQSAPNQLARPDRERPKWSLLLPAVQAAPQASTEDSEPEVRARRSNPDAGSSSSSVKDAHDRYANIETGYAASPAPRFVRFYKGAGDAKLAASNGARASSHRRIMPVAIMKRVDSAQSVVIGLAVPNCAVGNSYPNLTLKRGTMVIEGQNATITHCGARSTAMSIELTNATISQIRSEQQN